MLTHITHTLLDAARMEGKMEEAKALNPAHDSLYRGGSEESLAAVAPYIFQFHHPTPFSQWYMKHGWGDSWGILLKSSQPTQALHRHFRKFLMVKTEDGEQLYFRFYDPRVLRIFLPTCDPGQILEFFGPVDYFLMEDEDPGFAIRFWQENGILKQQHLRLEEIVNASSDKSRIPESINTPHPSVARPNAPSPAHDDQPQTAPKPKTNWNMFD